MSANWQEVQRRAAIPGSVVLQKFMDERRGMRNATYSSDVLDAFGLVPSSAAGVAVNPTSAMRVSAVYACVQRIAGAIASLPLHTYQRTTDGRQRADSPLWWLLNEQPTGRYSAASMWEKIAADILLRGDSFVFIGRDSFGNVKELIPLPHHCVSVVRDDTQIGGQLTYYVADSARNFGVDASDMIHVPGLGFDGVKSMSVIAYAARNATGTAMAMDEYAGKFFAGGAHPSIVLQTDGKMSADQITKLQQAFVSKYSGVDNAHARPLVLTEGLKADALSLTAADSQLLEARKFQVIDIARAFGVPPHLIGETSAATSWGSGIESMSRGFVTYTLQPHLVRIEQEINRKLWPKREKYFVEFNRDALLEGDSQAQAQYFRAALGGPGTGCGWMTVDEVRKIKNLVPMGGDMAEIYDPREVEPAPAPSEEADPNTKEQTAAARYVADRTLEAAKVQAKATTDRPAPVTNVTVEAPVVNVAQPSITVEQPDITVEAPVVNIAPPAVTVEAPVVNIAPPEVTANFEAIMPEQATPVVNLINNVEQAPVEVSVNLPTRKTETTIVRDAAGQMTKATQIERDA